MEGNNLEKFRSVHDEAHLYISQGITQEDPKIDRKDVALIMYQRGLGLLDMALCYDLEGSSEEHVKAQKMQQKMARTREHIYSRIIEITDILAPPISAGSRHSSQPTRPPPYAGGDPPYQEGASGTPSRPPPYSLGSNPPPRPSQTYSSQMSNSKRENQESNSNASDMSPSSSWEEGLIVFSMPDVQIFYINTNGEVSTPSYPETLHIVKFTRRGENKDLPPAFIELGTFTYPLVPGQSAILKSDYGGYILPDLEKGDGSSIGVILPDTSTQKERERLDGLFLKLTRSSSHDTSFKTQAEVDEEYAEYTEFSGAFAEGIVKGAEIVGKGMVKGAVKTSELLFLGTDYAKQYITPDQAARDIDPRVMKGLEIAHTVSSGACRVSGFVVSKVGTATMKLGRMAAPHLEKGATKALTHFSGQSRAESNNQLKIAGEIASGTLAAVSTLYMALENSSKILAKNIANNTVMMVGHKYGTDAAAVTNNALASAGNSYLAFYNVAALGPKGVAKRVAKDTGKAMIGFDPSEVNARASQAPDSNLDANSLLESLHSRANRNKEKRSLEDKTANKKLKEKKATSDKSRASSDKGKASSDKSKASSDKGKAISDKSKAIYEKSKASSDKSKVSSDKSKASSDMSKASSYKSKTNSDKSKANSDESKARSHKSKASSNISITRTDAFDNCYKKRNCVRID